MPLNKNIFALMFDFKLLFIALFSINFVYAQPPINMEQLNLKGKIRTLKISEYDAKEKNGEILKNGSIIPIRSIAFDINGNMEEQNIYNKDSSLHIKIIYEFDKGKLQEKKIYNKDASLKAKMVYVYNGKGNLVEVIKMVNNHPKFNIKNTYNDKNQIVEELGSKEKGMVFKKMYTYDQQGNKIGIDYFNKQNILYKKETFRYNTNNQLLSSTLKSEKQVNTNFGSTRVYDRAGQQQSNRRYHEGEYIDQQKMYTYNERGNKATMQDIENGELFSKSVFSYDKEENVIKEIAYFYDGDVVTNILVTQIDMIYY